MKRLDIDCVKKWAVTGSNKLSHPVSISTACPSCCKQVVFSTKRRYYDPHRDTLSCSSDCPACDGEVHFWITDMVSHTRRDEDTEPAVYMIPQATERLSLKGLEAIVPDDVLQHCASAQDAYYSGNLTATTIIGQATLESIFTSFMPTGSSRTHLSKLMHDALQSIELEKPLMTVSSALRPDQHLRQLLDKNDPQDQELADSLMALVELLIRYLYILPNEFAVLDKQLQALHQSKQAMPELPESTEADLQDSQYFDRAA